jgi:hypothetical protein
MTADQPNRHIRANYTFGGYALLRGQLCGLGLVPRTAGRREYRRVESHARLISRVRLSRPPDGLTALSRHLHRIRRSRRSAQEIARHQGASRGKPSAAIVAEALEITLWLLAMVEMVAAVALMLR